MSTKGYKRILCHGHHWKICSRHGSRTMLCTADVRIHWRPHNCQNWTKPILWCSGTVVTLHKDLGSHTSSLLTWVCNRGGSEDCTIEPLHTSQCYKLQSAFCGPLVLAVSMYVYPIFRLSLGIHWDSCLTLALTLRPCVCPFTYISCTAWWHYYQSCPQSINPFHIPRFIPYL